MVNFVDASARRKPPEADQQKDVDVKKVSGIYRIELGNGWFYIGSSVDLGRRKNSHLHKLRLSQHRNIRMQRCWNKYQIFDFIVIEKCDPQFVLSREQFYLDKHIDDEKNINIASVAGSPMTGRKHSPESRAKIGKAHRGKKLSNQVRLNMSLAFKKRGLSPEHKEKIRAANRGRIYTPEMRAEISARHTGRVKSPETCARLSTSLRGKRKSVEHRKKLSVAAKKRPPYSDEYKIKMSMATKGKSVSAETRQRMRDAWVLRRAKNKDK